MTGPAATGEILLGKYRVDPLIGPHPAGQLRAGLDLRFDRAVRLVLAQAPLEPRQLHREAQRQSRLRHPHLASLLDHGVLPDGKAALVFPEPPGDPLAFWLPEAREAAAVEVLDQLLRALARLHAAGVIHGGIRPELIRIEDRPTGPHATLGEVGLAQLLGPDQRLSAPPFAPPEGAGAPAGDVYSLAACFWRLGGGRTPRLAAALDQACAPDPAARLSTVAGLLEALDRPAPDLRALTPAPAARGNLEATALSMPSRPPAARPPLDVTALFTEATPPPAPPVSEGPTVVDGVAPKRDPRVRLSAEELAVALDLGSPTAPGVAPGGERAAAAAGGAAEDAADGAAGDVTRPHEALPAPGERAARLQAQRPLLLGLLGLLVLTLALVSWLWLG